MKIYSRDDEWRWAIDYKIQMLNINDGKKHKSQLWRNIFLRENLNLGKTLHENVIYFCLLKESELND